MTLAWVCDTCNRSHRTQSQIWKCPGCDIEVCDSCFDKFAHCKTCGRGKTDEELRLAANAEGFDFEPHWPKVN